MLPTAHKDPMRKTIQLTSERHKPAQALDAVKNTLRKYIKRERRKELPEGVDYWDFNCALGVDEDSAVPLHLAELFKRIDTLAEDGATEVYVEILAKPGVRQSRGAHNKPKKRA